MNRPRFGAGEPRYRFVLNRYPDAACTSCPDCGQKTGQHKRPLLIHVDPDHLIALNYTCRYCAACDILIGKRSDIEGFLKQMFEQIDPSVIGNDYLVFATVERKAWRENMQAPKPLDQMLEYIHDFKDYTVLQEMMGGWYRDREEQQPRQPPPPTDWVKGSR